MSLSPLTPPLYLISIPLFSPAPYTSHLPLTGEFQCIFNDDLAEKWMINCRMAILQSSRIKWWGEFTHLSFLWVFFHLHVSFFLNRRGTHARAQACKHARGAESCRWKYNASACLVSLSPSHSLTLLALLLWNPAHQVSLLTHLSIHALGGRG